MDKDTKQALEIIKRGSDEIIPEDAFKKLLTSCLLYTSPSPRDAS